MRLSVAEVEVFVVLLLDDWGVFLNPVDSERQRRCRVKQQLRTYPILRMS
jgi:hypothetical protein